MIKFFALEKLKTMNAIVIAISFNRRMVFFQIKLLQYCRSIFTSRYIITLLQLTMSLLLWAIYAYWAVFMIVHMGEEGRTSIAFHRCAMFAIRFEYHQRSIQIAYFSGCFLHSRFHSRSFFCLLLPSIYSTLLYRLITFISTNLFSSNSFHIKFALSFLRTIFLLYFLK